MGLDIWMYYFIIKHICLNPQRYHQNEKFSKSNLVHNLCNTIKNLFICRPEYTRLKRDRNEFRNDDFHTFYLWFRQPFFSPFGTPSAR